MLLNSRNLSFCFKVKCLLEQRVSINLKDVVKSLSTCSVCSKQVSTSTNFNDNRKVLLHKETNTNKIKWNKFHTSIEKNGRYGHRLVKLWEQKEYTTKPLQVYRTGGRLPVQNWKGDIVPGKVWTAKLGGGLPRQFYWVDQHRLTGQDVIDQVSYQERIIKVMEDDNRSGHIALVAGPWKRRWILCTQNMKPGELITNSARPLEEGVPMKDGDAFPLKHIPIGTKVCNVEFRPGKGGQVARSAGNYCTVVRKTETRAVLMMPSKRELHVNLNCVAVIGAISNPEHDDEVWGNQQTRFNYGLRPSTGRHHKKDGRFGHSALSVRPPVIIKEHDVLQKKTEFED